MGVGVHLKGSYPAPGGEAAAREWLDGVSGWFENDLPQLPPWDALSTHQRLAETHKKHPALFVKVHPGAEEVELSSPKPGRLVVSAKTSSLGPGYHIALCKVLREMGKARGVTWDKRGKKEGSTDDTGYFFTGDRAAVEREMLKHLRTVATMSLPMLEQHSHAQMSWAMPLGRNFEAGPLVTLTGPRSLAWLRQVAAEPEHGSDCYPWWNEGVGPKFRLGRALCQMWLNIRWRPTVHDDELPRWREVLGDLREAYTADPSLPYPWREWAELHDHVGADDDAVIEAVRARAGAAAGPLVGYRRRPVRAAIVNGWEITIPGEFAEGWEGNAWKAWDQTRTVYFNWWEMKKVDPKTKEGPPDPQTLLASAPLSEGEVLTFEHGPFFGRGVHRPNEEEGEGGWNLTGLTATAGHLAALNIFYPEEGDKDWAVDVWHSLVRRG